MKKTQSYIKKNKKRFLEELIDLLKIPSISADPKYKKDIAKTAKFVAKSLKDAGLDNVCLLYTSPSPRDRTRSRMPSSA